MDSHVQERWTGLLITHISCCSSPDPWMRNEKWRKRNLCYLQVLVISAVELNGDYMGSRLMNWGWNSISSELRQTCWSLLLCYVCYITVLLLLLGHAVRTGEHPGILKQRAACGGLFFHSTSNCWLECPLNECVCGQPLMQQCWRIQQCPGRCFLSSAL